MPLYTITIEETRIFKFLWTSDKREEELEREFRERWIEDSLPTFKSRDTLNKIEAKLGIH